MNGSDVIIGWILNGKVNFTDRFIYGRDVKIDRKQDVNLLYAIEKDEFTILKFKRPLKLCDSDDRSIEVIEFFLKL